MPPAHVSIHNCSCVRNAFTFLLPALTPSSCPLSLATTMGSNRIQTAYRLVHEMNKLNKKSREKQIACAEAWWWLVWGSDCTGWVGGERVVCNQLYLSCCVRPEGPWQLVYSKFPSPSDNPRKTMRSPVIKVGLPFLSIPAEREYREWLVHNRWSAYNICLRMNTSQRALYLVHLFLDPLFPCPPIPRACVPGGWCRLTGPRVNV